MKVCLALSLIFILCSVNTYAGGKDRLQLGAFAGIFQGDRHDSSMIVGVGGELRVPGNISLGADLSTSNDTDEYRYGVHFDFKGLFDFSDNQRVVPYLGFKVGKAKAKRWDSEEAESFSSYGPQVGIDYRLSDSVNLGLNCFLMYSGNCGDTTCDDEVWSVGLKFRP